MFSTCIHYSAHNPHPRSGRPAKPDSIYQFRNPKPRSSQRKSCLFYKFLEVYGLLSVYDVEILCGKDIRKMSQEEVSEETTRYKELFLTVADAVKELGDDDKFIESIQLVSGWTDAVAFKPALTIIPTTIAIISPC